MTFTFDLIKTRIKDSKYPFWNLQLIENFKNNSNIASYYGADFEENDSDDTKIEKSLQKLDSVVCSFPDDCVFVIEIKNARQANGSGILGPFKFQKVLKEEKKQNVLTGIPAGYIPQSALKGIEERLEKDFAMKLDNFKQEQKNEQQKREYERRLQDLDEREKHLKELERGYESGVAKTADVLVEAGKRILAYFMQGAPANAQAAPALSGTEDIPQDEKSKAIDDLAIYLYQNADTQVIKQLLSKLQNANNHATVQNENNTSNSSATRN